VTRSSRLLQQQLTVDLQQSVEEYWRDRIERHLCDEYLGIPLLKFPEDLRVYEQLLWETRTNVVVELGSHLGGSALWFRDRLRTFQRYDRIREPMVISIDVETARACESAATVDSSLESITFLEHDVLDPKLYERVRQVVPEDAMCLVVEDTAHTYETTRAALESLAPLVRPGGLFVVEDGCVDVEQLRVDRAWPRGVLAAIHDFLESAVGANFSMRKDLERYGITCHVNGYLERR
jgi:cephalosporin hydroxylase